MLRWRQSNNFFFNFFYPGLKIKLFLYFFNCCCKCSSIIKYDFGAKSIWSCFYQACTARWFNIGYGGLQAGISLFSFLNYFHNSFKFLKNKRRPIRLPHPRYAADGKNLEWRSPTYCHKIIVPLLSGLDFNNWRTLIL